MKLKNITIGFREGVILTSLLCLLSLGSCGNFSLYSSDNSPVVATVGEAELRESALQDIYSSSMNAEDSLQQRSRVINDWILGEVKKQSALSEIEKGGLSIDRIEEMVEEYRTTLLIHSLEHNYLAETLDTTVSKEQIAEYYKANKEGFKLAGPLVKARVVRLPEGLRQSKRLEKMFFEGDEEDLTDFLNICAKNDYKVVDMSGSWVEFSSVLRHIPFGYTNFDDFLSKNKRYEITDNEYKYLLRVEAYLPTGSPSPLEREEGTITKILRNLRRYDLLKELNDSLLNSAKESSLIIIE